MISFKLKNKYIFNKEQCYIVSPLTNDKGFGYEDTVLLPDNYEIFHLTAKIKLHKIKLFSFQQQNQMFSHIHL